MKRTSIFLYIVGLVYRFCFFYTGACYPVGFFRRRSFLVWEKVPKTTQLQVVLSCPWIDWKSKRPDFRNLESMRSYLLRDISCSKLTTKNRCTWGTCWWRRIYNPCQVIPSKRLSKGETIHMTFIQSTLSDRSGSFLSPKFTFLQRTDKQCKWVKHGRWGMSVWN